MTMNSSGNRTANIIPVTAWKLAYEYFTSQHLLSTDGKGN